MRKFEKKSFSRVLSLYQEATPSDWKHVPCEELSSERCGGWLLRDSNDMYIGWVGNRGDVTYAGYEQTTSSTKFDDKGRVVSS